MAIVANRHILNRLPEAEVSKIATIRVTRYIRTSRTMPMMATICLEGIFLEDLFLLMGNASPSLNFSLS